MGLAFYYDAFSELNTQRQVGMGIGPIPWADILAYGQFHGLRGSSLFEFKDTMLRVDRWYLRHQYDAIKAKKT